MCAECRPQNKHLNCVNALSAVYIALRDAHASCYIAAVKLILLLTHGYLTMRSHFCVVSNISIHTMAICGLTFGVMATNLINTAGGLQ
jgi:hypothetical protein